MLQQTQVERVVEYYRKFLHTFPSLKSLAMAPLASVLRVWSGLGYNRRARNLWRTAQMLQNSGARIPDEVEQLCQYPGIGPYTAGAIAAFAYNKATLFIDTNIRRVYIYYFLFQQKDITDREIMYYVKLTLDSVQPAKWYNALMDAGSILGKLLPENPNSKSRKYCKQSSFEGSIRQLRGAIVRKLVMHHSLHIDELAHILHISENRIQYVIDTLQKEGMLVCEERKVYLGSET
ncbi:hypothetical protein LSH36_793g01035 [Paralvinella palmiformis]|uniref:HhH-GPD domain-containing protein n=1 Tax=Paralvinella palmiformis TaxID=53620 RepID=A0AAD9J0V6_9ANNE|nr:hypothetical protein LSH36_793g01035 [Paralvinella palmiformis]